MKKILVLLFIVISSITSVDAATLVPNLMDQIARQEHINIQNAHTTRLAEQADRRAAARARLIAQKNKRLWNSTTLIASSWVKPPSQTQSPTLTISPPQMSSVSSTPSPPYVDMERVRSVWALWYNDTRSALGLGAYSYDNRLNSTAYGWNIEFAKWKALNHHTRNPWDGYYNFAVIDQWFIARGVNPIVISRAKHTENVGYGRYSCSSLDCTDTLIRSIRTTFEFFMSEKGKSYDAHYRSIVQPNFTKMGLSIIVVPDEQRYYLTVHYITQ